MRHGYIADAQVEHLMRGSPLECATEDAENT